MLNVLEAVRAAPLLFLVQPANLTTISEQITYAILLASLASILSNRIVPVLLVPMIVSLATVLDYAYHAA